MEQETSFCLLALSLCNATLVGLGLIHEPESGKMKKNLPVAKENIDLLLMLQQKTKGNLTQEESELLEGLLYDLRLKYVEASKIQ